MLFAVSLWPRVSLSPLSPSEEAARSVGLKRDSGCVVDDLWGGEEVDGTVKF